MLDAVQIKKDFPIFQQPIENGKPLIYLDNAATTQKPQVVIDAINQYYQKQNANIHRGIYTLAATATQAYENVRKQVQQFIGAGSHTSVIFTSGTTEGINLVANSFAAPRLLPGDEILISAMEHHSNLIPWQMICKQKGAHLRVIPLSENGELEIEQFEKLLTHRTRMLALVHISNSLGTVNPIKKMIERAHQKSIPVLIDAAQSMASHQINVSELDCDFLVFSGHKIFGPTGIGVLYGKEKWLEEMPPYQFGGEMIRSVSFEETTFAKLPHKFEAGTPNIAGVAGLGKAIEYINGIGKLKIENHNKQLLDYATTQLSVIDGFQIIGKAKKKSGILSFMIDGVHPHDVATILNEYGIAVRAGHHCAQPVMNFYNIPGTARASFSIYNTKSDINQLALAIEAVKQLFI